MSIGLFFREILPFYFRLVVLAAVTLFIDLVLHVTDLVWIGRYLGIPGVVLIVLSFGHSLRKRGLMQSDNPVRLLRLHEWLAWSAPRLSSSTPASISTPSLPGLLPPPWR